MGKKDETLWVISVNCPKNYETKGLFVMKSYKRMRTLAWEELLLDQT